MKLIPLLALLCFAAVLYGQSNNNPTIAVCNGNQYVCATGSMSQLCVNIIVDPSYPNINFIDKFEINWGDGSPITTVPGSTNPSSQSHTYDLTDFFGTCQPYREYDIKLLTKHTNGALPANNSFTLTFINPPTVGIMLSDPVICTGQSVDITDQSCPSDGLMNSNWTFGDGASLNGQIQTSHTYTPAGSYTITHTITNTCGTASGSTNITVLNPPVADMKIDSGALAGTPPVVCLGGGGVVKMDAGISLNETSYMWSITPSSGWQWWPLASPTPTGPKPRIKFTQPGTYVIKVKVNNDCNMPDEKTLEIKVVQAPLLSLSPQPDGCQGISYSPNPLAPGATYTINGNVVAQSSFPVMLAISGMPYIVAATLTNECGMQTRRDTFSLSAPQDVNITAPATNPTVCTGSAPIILTATPGGGSWSGQHISQVGGNTVFTPPSVPGVFLLKYSRGAGNCERKDEVTITVEPAYNLQLAPQPDNCVALNYAPVPNDPNVTYTLQGVVQTQWPVNLPVSNSAYIVTAAVTNVCGTKTLADTFLVISPLAVHIQTPAQDTVVCQNSAPLPLSADLPDGDWAGQHIGGAAGNETFDPGTVGTFPVVYIRGTGNCERRDTVVIQVEAAYNLQLGPQPDDCISLSYAPMPNDPNATYTLNGATQTQFPQTLSVATTPNIVRASFTNVCGTKVLTDTFFVRAPTPVNILAPTDTSVCQNSGTLTLSAEPPDGHWEGQNISGTVFTPATGGVFPLIYVGGAGNCEKRDTVEVEVIAVNIAAGEDLSGCILDAPLTLTGFMPATGGAWTGTGITSPLGNFDPGTAGIGGHVLTYEFKDTILGCTFRDSLTVQVHPMPGSNFPTPVSACINEEIQFENLSVSTFEVLWDFGDGQSSTLAEPVHVYTDTGTYTIKLLTTNEFDCSDMMTRTIFVTEPPQVFFTPLPDSGCAVLPVLFENESHGWQTTYAWAFGNLQTDSSYTPDPLLLPGGTKDTFYVVTLTATNLCAARIWTDSILVHPLPLAVPGTTVDTICSGQTIVFANPSLGQPQSFAWDFGNGQTSTDSLPAPMQYFTDSLFRTYALRLIATNFCGTDTAEHTITVKPADVQAFFNVPNLIGCQPYTVQFTSFATPGATVAWVFGDGNTSSATHPQHTFQLPGIFKVVQKASDGCGYDSTLAYIEVLPAPGVSFDGLPQVCRGDTLFFTNTSPGPLAGVHWNFGDGDSSLLYHPTHVFDSAGIKMVVLTGISAENGCPAPFSRPVTVLELPIVQFTPDQPDGCVPLTVSFQNQSQGPLYFEWDFGDGNTQPGPTPTHTFQTAGQFEVKLLGIDQNSCRNDTLLRYITVHPIPSPAFELQRDRLCGLPVTVAFLNQTPDAVGYEWDFGDGSSGSVDNNPQHVYGQPGDFEVRLFAENAFGCRAAAMRTFSAYADPMAGFDWTPAEGCAPLTVIFENLSTFTTSAQWFFSDGGQSDSLVRTVHTFHESGEYGATLVVSHRDVCFDTLPMPGIIEVFPSPTANFSFVETVTAPPSAMFTFTDLSVGASRWLWQFGDGDSSELQNPAHRYFSNGQKLVKLTAWGANGCPDDTIIGVTPMLIHGLFLPNAFTPGLANGEAAIFQPKGVGLRELEIALYSSYGQLLWSSGTEDLLAGQPGPGWDGTFQGASMPQDVYTWQIKKATFEDGSLWKGKQVGSVTLIR